MDAQTWQSCEDPRKMLEWLRGIASSRKLRLFVVAFWRVWWDSWTDPGPDEEPDHEIIELLEFTEQWAESGTRPATSISFGYGFKWHPLAARNAFDAANWTIRQTAGSKARLDCMRYDAKDQLRAAALQARLLREIFGNPYTSMTVDAACLSPTVHNLAQTIYNGGDFSALPILADALEDAGCTDPAILEHCRGNGRHVRGCWLLDLLLSRT
jgi:hypothetical protein